MVPALVASVRIPCMCAVMWLAVASAHAQVHLITRCPPDSVLVGQLCVDKYEASVWQVPETNSSGVSNSWLISHIKRGLATAGELKAGNAVQISPSSASVLATSCESDKACGTCDAPTFPATFPLDGQWTQPLYAVALPGVRPTACVSWFQAAEACRSAGKRLITNLEWQDAAAGTPDQPQGADDGANDCNVNSAMHAVEGGSRPSCKSNWGSYDMVGNVDEWVAEWVVFSTGCPGWGSFSEDYMCLSGASEMAFGPGALTRGGGFKSGSGAGAFAVSARNLPYATGGTLGFRCAR